MIACLNLMPQEWLYDLSKNFMEEDLVSTCSFRSRLSFFCYLWILLYLFVSAFNENLFDLNYFTTFPSPTLSRQNKCQMQT